MDAPLTPALGTRITVYDGAWNHGIVVKWLPDDALAFQHYVLGYGRVSGASFTVHVADEGATWVRGLMHGWWPPHRRIRHAMRSAYTMDSGHGVRIFQTRAEYQTMVFQKRWDGLMGDVERMVGGYERSVDLMKSIKGTFFRRR